jgi:signal peptidase II
MHTANHFARVLIPAALVILVDQVTKALVIRSLPIGSQWPSEPVAGLFSFTHVSNTGVAFGLFQGNSSFFVLLAVVVVCALWLYLRRLPHHADSVRLAVGLQIGGALGNVIDRIRIGHVTDFLDFQVWPVFNLADTSIFLGVVLLGWEMWREERETARAEPVAPTEPDGDGALAVSGYAADRR